MAEERNTLEKRDRWYMPVQKKAYNTCYSQAPIQVLARVATA